MWDLIVSVPDRCLSFSLEIAFHANQKLDLMTCSKNFEKSYLLPKIYLWYIQFDRFATYFRMPGRCG